MAQVAGSVHTDSGEIIARRSSVTPGELRVSNRYSTGVFLVHLAITIHNENFLASLHRDPEPSPCLVSEEG